MLKKFFIVTAVFVATFGITGYLRGKRDRIARSLEVQ